MATCPYCNQEMTASNACTLQEYDDFKDGVARERVPFTLEGVDTCIDCNTPNGGLHHPGCDGERCPSCGGQAISCSCAGDEDEDEEDGGA